MRIYFHEYCGNDLLEEGVEAELCAKVIILLVIMYAALFTCAESVSVYMEGRPCCIVTGTASGYYTCICYVYRQTHLTLKIVKFSTTTTTKR